MSAFQLINDEDYLDYHVVVQLLVQYITTATIVLLNALLPILFGFLVKFEDYSPAVTVNVNLAR